MKNILFLGIVLELIVFSTILILETSPKTASNIPMKEMAIYEEKSISEAFINTRVLPVSNDPLSLRDLKARYYSLFKDLEVSTHNQLESLADQAYEEYIDGDKDLVHLLSMTKYANELKALEKETDEAFYQIYDELSRELVLNGFSTAEAIEFKNDYEAKKKSRVEEIIKIATSEMNDF
jgi:hypothetical protein